MWLLVGCWLIRPFPPWCARETRFDRQLLQHAELAALNGPVLVLCRRWTTATAAQMRSRKRYSDALAQVRRYVRLRPRPRLTE